MILIQKERRKKEEEKRKKGRKRAIKLKVPGDFLIWTPLIISENLTVVMSVCA